MGSSINSIADQPSNEYLSLQTCEVPEAEGKRFRAERWYSNIVSEKIEIPFEYLHVLAPIEDDELQPD